MRRRPGNQRATKPDQRRVGQVSRHGGCRGEDHQHLNQQPDPADPYDAFSGSSGLTAAVEGILLLTRQRGQADAYLTVDGKDIKERKELALKWDGEICTWTVQGDAEEYKISKARREVLAVVGGADDPVTPTYVADALGKIFNTVKKMMWEMSRDGQLASNGDGAYYLPNNGNCSNSSNRSNPSNPADGSVTSVTGVTGAAHGSGNPLGGEG